MTMLSCTRVSFRSGSEGPRHDPYAWTEIEVKRNGMQVILHSSALYDDWMVVQRRGHDAYRYDRDDPVHPMQWDELHDAFEKLTGQPMHLWEKWHRIAQNRCVCGGKRWKCAGSGYVGEGVYECIRCGALQFGEVTTAMIE